jgi:coenzyme F420 hydrogenase subunit beta
MRKLSIVSRRRWPDWAEPSVKVGVPPPKKKKAAAPTGRDPEPTVPPAAAEAPPADAG